MKLIPDWVYGIVIAALLAMLAVQQVRLSGEKTLHAKTKLAYAEEKESTRELALIKQQDKDRAVANLDTKYTKELTHAKSEINRLAADVRAGERKLRLHATCPDATTSSLSEATVSTSMANATGPRLDNTVERDYFDLRAGIATATSQINGLQNYITTVCLK